MTEEEFQREMIRARIFSALGDHFDFWQGYQRGLQRVYRGENFGTPEEHEKWLSLADDEDVHRRESGKGYREGLKLQHGQRFKLKPL